jgi:hypothetical protein
MANEQRRLGDHLLEALEEMSEPATLSSGEIEARVATVQRLLAQARREIDEEDTASAAILTEQDVIGFVEDGRPLSHDQQRLLFTDTALRELFRKLKRQHAVPLPASARSAARQADDAPTVEMRPLIAAATDQGEDFDRSFAGGNLTIRPVGIDRQVYVVFTFDDPAIATRRLIIERSRDQRAESLELPPPDDGEIMLVKDLADPADADLVDLLRDPTTSGTFKS